jgi:hypothetical protein
VIPSVDDAAIVELKATATYRFCTPVVTDAVVACTYTFPEFTCNFCDGAVVPMPTLPALVMMKFPPAEFENCTTFPVVLDPTTVRTFAEAAGVALNVAAAVDVMAPTFRVWDTMTLPA